MLETVREYGLERLRADGEEEATRARHAAWCSALAERVDAALSAGRDRARHLDLLAVEIDNVRAAVAWLIRTGDAAAAVELAGGVGSFWFVRGHLSEGRAVLEQALALPGDVSPGARARARAVLGMVGAFQHDFRCATAAADEAAAVAAAAADRRGLALARLAQAIVALSTGAVEAAVVAGEASIALYRELGAEGDLDTAYLCTALGLRARGEFDRAEALLREGLRSAERRGDDYGVAVAHEGLGTVPATRGTTGRSAALRRGSGSAPSRRGAVARRVVPGGSGAGGGRGQPGVGGAPPRRGRGTAERNRCADPGAAPPAPRPRRDAHPGVPRRRAIHRGLGPGGADDPGGHRRGGAGRGAALGGGPIDGRTVVAAAVNFLAVSSVAVPTARGWPIRWALDPPVTWSDDLSLGGQAGCVSMDNTLTTPSQHPAGQSVGEAWVGEGEEGGGRRVVGVLMTCLLLCRP